MKTHCPKKKPKDPKGPKGPKRSQRKADEGALAGIAGDCRGLRRIAEDCGGFSVALVNDVALTTLTHQ